MAQPNWRSDWREKLVDLTTDTEGSDGQASRRSYPVQDNTQWPIVPVPGSYAAQHIAPSQPHSVAGHIYPAPPPSNMMPPSITPPYSATQPWVGTNQHQRWNHNATYTNRVPVLAGSTNTWSSEQAEKRRKLSDQKARPDSRGHAASTFSTIATSTPKQSLPSDRSSAGLQTEARNVRDQQSGSVISLPTFATPVYSSQPETLHTRPTSADGSLPLPQSQSQIEQPQQNRIVPEETGITKSNRVAQSSPSNTPNWTHVQRVEQTPIPTRIDLTQTQSPRNGTPQTVKRSMAQFSEEEEHYLIFLKEVKRFGWKTITEEFQKEYPERTYTTLQSRYSTKINKRDRSLDPQVLKLPSRWISENTIDWNIVHAGAPGLRQSAETTPRFTESKTTIHMRKPRQDHFVDEDYSSNTDSDFRQERPRRAPRIDYDVRKRLKGLELASQDDVVDKAGPISRDATPPEEIPVPPPAIAVDNDPIVVDFDRQDTMLAFAAAQKSSTIHQLPYLSSKERATISKPPNGWQWDQLSSRQYQGSVLHVDFCPEELAVVEEIVSTIIKTRNHLRHSTNRRRFRAMLRQVPDPKLRHLASKIHKRLPARSIKSIDAFFEDAKNGRLSNSPRVERLAAARPLKNMASFYKDSTRAMVRQRELGTESRRGWKSSSKAVTYQLKNKIMDSMGPVFSWTGASSDIHTVAWSPNGSMFAAGAVAVTDPDSMQYNRPNNLLFGDIVDNKIYELAEHNKNRTRTETGANSSHAMFASQDPNLYTTVTAVAFSPSGNLMFSGGYDESICIWQVESAAQPTICIKLRHKAEIEMMVANPRYNGIVATAAKRMSTSTVKLLSFDENQVHDLDVTNPTHFRQQPFYSEKAVSRADLRILPQALRFEPIDGRLLLAGFGANARQDENFDITGDLCLWDIETSAQLPLHGSSRNVLDVAFNPLQRYGPLFAAGCVASGNVNRGTRSVIRLYDEGTHNKYTCPIEIECRALDMNDVVWCPHDENLISAGCTDGRVYVWDLRHVKDPLRILSHGASSMPLPDGVPHERTDTGVRFLSWGENATRLYSGSSDGIVKTWDVTRSVEDTFIKDIFATDSGIMSGSFSPDFTRLVVGEVNGSVNVLEVGRDDCSTKGAQKLLYIPYDVNSGVAEEDHVNPGEVKESGVADSKYLLDTQQLQLAPMGNLPVRQAIQGPNYQGPYDQSIDAPFLREQALQFQLNMTQAGPQCDIPACKDNMAKVTCEDIGDSKRSADRIPDELCLQWKALDPDMQQLIGKAKCSHCSRPARPSLDDSQSALCERCAFSCFRCGASNPIAPSTTILICDSCAGVWDIGVLGYECTDQPLSAGKKLDVPGLRSYGREMLEQSFEEEDASCGDEVNALTDYYFSLAIDRPESPPL